jgi:hypothetical protein
MKTYKQIVNQLEKNVDALKLAYHDLLTTKQSEGKVKYGSVAEFKKVKENIRTQIYTLNTFLEWVYLNDNEPLQNFNPSDYENKNK